jgi:GT2 family glycosyltransferase
VEPGGEPTFSVLIAAYQAADTVAEAVESVLAQTRSPLEIVVCDDGSTDGTDAVLRRFGDSIRVIHQPNRGVAAARNTLIREARGDFGAFLDADDAFLPERLEALTELAVARPDLDILATDAYIERGGERVARLSEVLGFPVERQAAEMTRRSYLFSPAIRRRTILAAGGFDETLISGEDWDCWLRMLLDGAAVGMVDEALIVYRVTPGSLTDDRSASLAARVVLLERAREHPALTASEREELDGQLKIHRMRALVADADAATALGKKGATRLLLKVAGTREADVRVRVRALAIALAPRLARAAGASRLDRRPDFSA